MDKINERLARIETDIKNIKGFINPYLKGQIAEIKATMGKMDNRIWWILGVVVAVGILAKFLQGEEDVENNKSDIFSFSGHLGNSEENKTK